MSRLEVHRNMSLEDAPDGYDPLPGLSTSFFSTISIDDIYSDMEVDDDEAMLDELCFGLESACSSVSPVDCFNRISKQGRKLLRSARLPIEHILEFEALIFDHLSSKTPRHRFLANEEHFLTMTVQNPFRRSLLHAVCQYYRLASQTVDKEAGLTAIKATPSSNLMPLQRLSTFLVISFGHALPVLSS